MSDKLIVTGDSPEAVAYALMFGIAAKAEKISWGPPPVVAADEEWILETYAKCLRAAKGMSLK